MHAHHRKIIQAGQENTLSSVLHRPPGPLPRRTTVPFPGCSSWKSLHVHACMCVRECIWIYASPLFLIELLFFLRIYCVSCFLHSKMYLGDFFISVHRALTHLLFSQLFMASHFVARSQFIYLLGLFPVYCRFKQCCSILPQTCMLCMHGKVLLQDRW